VDASNFRDNVLGFRPSLTFPPIMFDTRGAGWHLPLQVMRTDNLEQLIANRGGPAAVKKAPNSESKSILIYDLEALEKRFGRDDALTYSQWMDAVIHRAAFESLWDEQGPSGPYAVQIALLHNFFCNLRNAEESFQVW
ncbi:hypothetical protein FISHEDRAFT_31688, partial [Fistulina hepatica ATCC 64428]